MSNLKIKGDQMFRFWFKTYLADIFDSKSQNRPFRADRDIWKYFLPEQKFCVRDGILVVASLTLYLLALKTSLASFILAGRPLIVGSLRTCRSPTKGHSFPTPGSLKSHKIHQLLELLEKLFLFLAKLFRFQLKFNIFLYALESRVAQDVSVPLQFRQRRTFFVSV